MREDISDILEGWKYDPYKINVRVITGKDKKKRLQLRLDLGLLQMEMDGRPDGKRPHNMESFFEYYRCLAKEHYLKTEDVEDFTLDVDDLIKLQQESLQYYHRYLCFFQLEDFIRAERDTERNLAVISFVEKHCDNEEDFWNFTQYWPYIKMMNTRAKAAQILLHKNYDKALELIFNGIETIKEFYIEYDMDVSPDDSSEIMFLENWAESIIDSKPLSSRQKLEKELEHAINRQAYEKAAKIRDKLRSMKN